MGRGNARTASHPLCGNFYVANRGHALREIDDMPPMLADLYRRLERTLQEWVDTAAPLSKGVMCFCCCPEDEPSMGDVTQVLLGFVAATLTEFVGRLDPEHEDTNPLWAAQTAREFHAMLLERLG
jgi:hypothetical protein